MEEDITLEHEGETYTASYIVINDELTVYLPDGSERYTELSGGVPPESAARTHLRGYIRSLKHP